MREIILKAGERSGETLAPVSKSYAHRLLICAALGGTRRNINESSDDITATQRCLEALLAEDTGEVILPCGESGSTLRFLLPLCGALGKNAVFSMEGRLPERPLSPLDAVLRAHGMEIERRGTELICGGKLNSGTFEIVGDVSSQFVSGLLFALPLLKGDSTLRVTGKTESKAYIAMTESAIKRAGIRFERRANEYTLFGDQHYAPFDAPSIEGDWSNAAFFLCMGALSESGVTVKNLPQSSLQGDREILQILSRFGADVCIAGDAVTVKRNKLTGLMIDAADIPDLVPVLSVLAAAAEGETRIVNAARLRYKESDRLHSAAQMLCALGGRAEELPDGLIISGTGGFTGGTVNSCGDHRIAMSAAVAACASTAAVTVQDPDCVKKSFPQFWENFAKLERTP